MAAAGAARLYSPAILALAVSLADYPLTADHPRTGESRSRTCGSTVTVAFECDAAGAITRTGLQVRACAIGQAAAALFAQGAAGKTGADLSEVLAGLERWTSGEGSCPDWPGLEVLEPAIAYPARHGAILLPWKAAIAALGNPQTSG